MAAKDLPSPKILFPHWQNEYAAALLELTGKGFLSESQPQKPQSTSGSSKFRKILTIKPRDESSIARWRIFAFFKRE
jgi:hypothetical protein